MKKATLLSSSLLVMAVILSTGCTKSQVNSDIDKIIADTNKKLEESKRDSDRIIENMNTMMSQGGQPGTITLNGVTVIDTDKIDSRITLSQEAGLPRTGSATSLAKDLVVLKSLKTEAIDKIKENSIKLEEKRTYLNLGCELAESEIAGLTEVSSATATVSSTAAITPLPSASRVFICGEQNLSEKIVISISASDIMLKDASITMLQNPGVVNLTAKSLVLVGKNKITTLGKNASGLLSAAASISLTVTNEIYGDGELALISKGGNNVAEQKQESK